VKESPNHELNLLIQLQTIDRSIIEKRSYLNTPHNLPILNEEDPTVDLYKYRKKYVDEIKTSYSAAKSDLEHINRALSSAGGFKSKIKTNVEYREYTEKVELLTHKREVLVEKVRELAKKMTDEMIELSKMEERIAEGRKLSDRETAKCMTKMEDFRSEVTDLYKTRTIIVQSIDNSLYELYMSLMECCGGSAVVEAADRVCKGCQLIMPRNIYLNVLSFAEVVQCPNCIRILYHSSHLISPNKSGELKECPSNII
jgi:predicted  nucleic acid-binding Zn-ribbon protein